MIFAFLAFHPGITLFAIVSRIVFIVVATAIFAIALVTYSRLRNRKTLLLTVGFGLFFVHGLSAIPELFIASYDNVYTDSAHLLIDAVALLIILIAVLQD